MRGSQSARRRVGAMKELGRWLDPNAITWIAQAMTPLMTRFAARARRLPDRRGVLDAARAPELVEPARNLQFRAAADIAIVDLAVIADMADDAGGPIPGEAEVLAIGTFGADQSHHVGLLGLQRFVDVLGVHAELLGIDHRIQRPLHDQHPVVIPL